MNKALCLEWVIEELEEYFPIKEFTPSDRHSDIMYHMGKRHSITILRRKLEEMIEEETIRNL